jgi:outer membrane protein TolC
VSTVVLADDLSQSDTRYEALTLPVELRISIPDRPTLTDYLKLAMDRNPGLRSAFARWTAEQKKSSHVGALPDPVLSYAYYIENVETRVGPQQHRLGLRQSFPWFGTLGAKKDAASKMAEVAFQNLESERQKLFYQVKAAYYDYYFVGRNLEIAIANFELLRFWESIAQVKYQVGLSQHPDLIKAQVELGKLDDLRISLESKLDPTAAKLRALLNLPESVGLPIPDSLDVPEFLLDRDAILDSIRINNPDLLALSNLIEREEANLRLASLSARPSFSVGVDYIQTGPAINPQLAESGKDPWMIGVGVSLPIWFGKNGGRRSEARARLRSAEYDLENNRNQLTAYAEQVLFAYEDALRRVSFYQGGLMPKAEQALNAGYAAYQAGTTDFLNLLDAQRQLLEFQLTAEREKVRLAKAAAELEMLSGNELTEFWK